MPSTQVRVVGLIQVTALSSTADAVVFFFLVARWGLDWPVAAVLLPFSSLEETEAGWLCALEFDVVLVVDCRDCGVSLGAFGPTGGEVSCASSDSGTNLSSMGRVLGPTPAPITGSPEDDSPVS